MAMIDYGVLVIKNGIPINKNGDLFMESPDYMPTEFADDYCAYCGDEELTLCFYKCCVEIIKNGKLVHSFWHHPFKEETHYLGETNLTIRRLDDLIPEYYTHFFDCDTWEDYVRERWSGATGFEKDSQLEDGRKYHRLWVRRCKAIGKNKNKPIYYKSTLKYSATWEYKGDKWEVIFGYGIDPKEDIFIDITNKGKYNYGEKSIQYIKEKFFNG